MELGKKYRRNALLSNFLKSKSWTTINFGNSFLKRIGFHFIRVTIFAGIMDEEKTRSIPSLRIFNFDENCEKVQQKIENRRSRLPNFRILSFLSAIILGKEIDFQPDEWNAGEIVFIIIFRFHRSVLFSSFHKACRKCDRNEEDIQACGT